MDEKEIEQLIEETPALLELLENLELLPSQTDLRADKEKRRLIAEAWKDNLK
jgi:hypothetical protein